MAPLRALNLPVLTPQVLQFFAAHGIISVEDFLIHDLYTLAAIAEHQGSSEVLKQAIAEILSFVDKQHAQWLTGAQLVNSIQKNKHVLPTGCEGVDSLLGGGLLEGTLTELVGPSASGKTQICLRATSHIAFHSQAAVMYLDTCNSFSSKRIVDFLDDLSKSSVKSKDQQIKFEKTMKEILHYNVFDIYSMLDLLHHTELCMRTQDKNRNPMVRLLIVDSVSSVITPVLSGSNLQGHSLMISLGTILKKLALEYNLAVLSAMENMLNSVDVIEINNSNVPRVLPNQSPPSINQTGFPMNSILEFSTGVALSCINMLEHAKATCSAIWFVQDTNVMLMEARVLEFYATCDMLTSYCNFLRDMHTDDYYALGCAPSIKIAFQNYLNNV